MAAPEKALQTSDRRPTIKRVSKPNPKTVDSSRGKQESLQQNKTTIKTTQHRMEEDESLC
jgi:hypothetical protein